MRELGQSFVWFPYHRQEQINTNIVHENYDLFIKCTEKLFPLIFLLHFNGKTCVLSLKLPYKNCP
jgi:hypothetical protein